VILKECKDSDPDSIDIYRNENLILDILKDEPNVVKKLDWYIPQYDPKDFFTPNFFCIVLEELEPFDLKKCCSNVKSIGRYLKQIVQGIQQINSHDIVHMDINPNNIMLSKEGKVKIIDFGLAHRYISGSPLPYQGTHGFIAPEVENEEIVYVNGADIWSAGIVLLCMLAQLLFGSEYSNSHFNEWKESIFEKIKNRNERLCDLMMQMIANDPNDRPNPETILNKIDSIFSFAEPKSLKTELRATPNKIEIF